MSEHETTPVDERDPFDALLRRAARLPVPSQGSLPTTLASGFELCGGRFRVLRELGSGGMGVVYEALDRKRGGPVAIKTLSRLDPRDIYRLKGEFRSLEAVVHPNLVRLHELFADEGRWLFSMEQVDGVPFDEWVRPGGQLDLERLRHVVPQLVTGVCAIHAAGTLHRDLKPSNMLITAEGRLVILDFGLAADPEPGGVGQTVRDGFTAGTPAYMAPEQAAGLVASAASDWYAVGVMLHEACTGELPFDGGVDEILRAKQVGEAPARPEIAALDAELAVLCGRLLRREPTERPDGEELSRRFGAPEPPRTSRPVAAAGERLRLHGREHELAALERAYGRSEAGEAVVVRVLGESGMGKTALVSEFLLSQRAGGRAVVLDGRCYERESLPYKAVDRVVDELSRYLRQLTAVEAAALMPRAVFALARIFPALARLDCVQAVPARSVDDDQELRRLAFDAFAELMARIRDRQPLIVHIDDMHWTDRDSVLLLSRLFHGDPPCPLMLIVSHRGSPEASPRGHAQSGPSLGPDEPAELTGLIESLRGARGVGWVDCALGPLDAAAVGSLVRSLLPAAGAPSFDEAELAREAGGNPLLVDTLVRHLVQTGASGARGPLRLQEAIDGRLRELGEAARSVFEVLAVAGRPLPVEVLRDVHSAMQSGVIADGNGDVHGALDRLRASRLVSVDARGAVACYHERFQALVAERMDADAAATLHRRLARAWARHGGAEPEVLFGHWLAAGERPEAGRYAVRAAAEANHSLAFDRAAALYRHALQLLPESSTAELELHERLAECLSLAGRWADAGLAFEAASLRVRRPQHARRLRQQAAMHLLASGRGEAGMPLLRDSLAQAGLRWPRTKMGAALVTVFRVLWLRVRGAAAAARAPEEAAPRASSPGQHLRRAEDADDLPEALAGETLLAAAALVPIYDLVRGLYYMTGFAARGLRTRDRAVLALAAGMASNVVGVVAGGRSLSRRLATRATELARSEVPPELAAATFGFAGFAALLDGRLRDARELGAEGSSRLRGVGRAHAYQAWGARSVECFALTLSGHVGEAARLFAATEEDARELGDRVALLAGSSVLRHLTHDDVPAAERLLREKEQLAGEIGEGGVVHAIVGIERVLIALYCGRGHEVLDRIPRPTPGLTPVDTVALEASCALQALQVLRAQCARGEGRGVGAIDAEDGGGQRERLQLLRRVRAARRRLRRAGTHAGRGMATQLDAALHCLGGERARVLEALELSRQDYERAEMWLHAALMTWRRAQLRAAAGDCEHAEVLDAERRLAELGVVSISGWANLMAPGLTLP